MVYRPRNVQQEDGSYWQYSNCMMASSATALDRHTLGRKKSTGSKMRLCQYDRIGGTDVTDIRTAWSRCYAEYFDVRLKTSWATFISAIRAGRGAVLAGWYNQIPSTYRGQMSSNFAHAVYINEIRASDGALLMYDPLRYSPVWVPQIYIKRFAAQMLVSSGRIGYGYAQYGLTRDTEPTPPKTPNTAVTVTLRYGGAKITPVVKVATVSARQRRSPYIRSDNTIRTVAKGTRFGVYQKTTSGTKVGTAANASTWYGNASGTVWMHASVVKNA